MTFLPPDLPVIDHPTATAGWPYDAEAATRFIAGGHRLWRRVLDGIWHIAGTLPLAADRTGDDAFDRLDPLFRQSGTTRERIGDMLVFRKKDQAAQDSMSIFDTGVLRIEQGEAERVLRYRLSSRALLFCFLAPLLFLGIAQSIKLLARLDQSSAGSSKAPKPAKKPEAVRPLNPIDKFLGAPAPDTKADKEDAGGDEDGGGKKPSTTPAYVFAGIFAALYVIGRVVEDRLVRRLFKRALAGDDAPQASTPERSSRPSWFRRSRSMTASRDEENYSH